MNTHEDQLTAELHQLVAAQPFTPDIDGIARRAVRARRRAVIVRSAGVAGIAVAGAVAAFAAIGPGGTPAVDRSPGHHHSNPPVALPSTAPPVHAIVAHTLAALSTAGQNSVERTVVSTADGVNRFYVDQPDQISAILHFTHGRKETELSTRLEPGTKGTYLTRLVDYRVRTWTERSSAGSSALAIPNPAAEFRQILKPSQNGRARFVGTAVVDGIPAYTLHLTGLHSTKNTATIWISKATYLPIKSVSPGATVRYYWSGPGSVKAASLWPAVPAGFRRVGYFPEMTQGFRDGL